MMYKTEANKRIEAKSALCLFCHNNPSKAEFPHDRYILSVFLTFIYKTDSAGTVCSAVYRINDLASVLHNLKDPHNILFCFQCDSQ